jgi:hypothetical protein
MSGTHGHAARDRESPEYRSWRKMRSRCTRRDVKSARYIDSGITVCESWMHSFEAFLRDMGSKPTPRHSIERMDNSKGYNKQNCRWATRFEQDRNKTTNVFYSINGSLLCQKDFADLFGVTDATIIAKRKKGLSQEEIISYYEGKHNKSYYQLRAAA